ncbi:MAG: glycoside hydrolase family protein [Rhodobacteraceae bacterium]|nr:glycoside hydrolase family protein [Paracoccaceae bacterium]
MRTSERGVAFIERHEAVVLRAYRDPVGVWTIGAGLTAASGVADPGPGMVITREEASRLLAEALRRRYEPAVSRAMPTARQHEFDGGVSFHFNTGAISRASWVPAWASGNMAKAREKLALWNKGGGRVLPGLTRRRAEEANLIEYGDYGVPVPPQLPRHLARMPLALSPEELTAIRRGFADIGLHPGDDPRGVAVETVRAFQEASDLTVDGILGRATLSTLQRRLDARAGAALGSVVTTAGGVDVAADPLPADWLLGWGGEIALTIGLIGLAWIAWHYRDVVAAKLHRIAPRLAAYLRSIK